MCSSWASSLSSMTMASVQRMRMLLLNAHVDLDAQPVRTISQLLDNLVVGHRLKAAVLMLYDAGFGPTAFRLRPPNASGRIAAKRAIDRGVDVRIVYHDTKKDDDPNRAAIAKARLPKSVTHVRTRTKIPHNKFIVKLVGETPLQVWTGSTNFTDTGFFGQTNVGHQSADANLAKTYFDYWTE